MNTIALTAPGSWQELRPEQVVFVAKQYLSQVSRPELLTRSLLHFTGVTLLKRYPAVDENEGERFEFKKGKVRFSLSAETLRGLSEQLAYLTDTIGLMPCPTSIAGYPCPEYRLYNHTLEEYLMADAYYLAFSREKTIEALHRLTAVLYRAQATPYRDVDLELRARRLRRAPLPLLYGVYLWYTGFKAWLRDKYPLLFSPSDEQGTDTSPDERIFGLLETLNEGKPQDNDRILKTHVHEVLYSLQAKIERYNDLKNK